jgi:hypothetical protein
MEQLINHGGGLDKLVKAGWDRYGWHEKHKNIRRSLSVNHSCIPMRENKSEPERTGEQSRATTTREHTQCQLRNLSPKMNGERSTSSTTGPPWDE